MADTAVLAVKAHEQREQIRALIEEHASPETVEHLDAYYGEIRPARIGDPETDLYNVELMAGLAEVVAKQAREIERLKGDAGE